MNTPDLIARLRAELLGMIAGAAQSVIAFSRITTTSVDGSEDGVAGWPADGGDPDSGQETVRRMEPWGLHGRPATGIQGLVARVMGGEAQGLLAGIWTGGHGRQELPEGATQMYCKVAGCEVYLDHSGTLQINTPAGQDVVVNQGAAKVAVHGDATAGHTHAIPALTVSGAATEPGVTGSATDTINVTAPRRFKG